MYREILVLIVKLVFLPIILAAPLRGNDYSEKQGARPRFIDVNDIATAFADKKKQTPSGTWGDRETPNDHATLDPLQPASPSQHPPSESVEVDRSVTAAQQNPLEKMGATEAVKSGTPAQADAKGEHGMIKTWFTWEFWQLMVLCALTILFFSEVVTTIVRWFVAPSLIIDSCIFCVQMICFLLVAAIFSTPRAAGGNHTRTLATVMAALSLLIFIGSLSLKIHKVTPQTHHVADDLGHLFRPFSRLIVVFLIMNGVLEESAADWGNLVMLGSCIALGVAFAMSGVVKDIVCYMFIRLDDYFCENEFIYHKGGLYRVDHIFWRYTEAYSITTRSLTLIPNSEIACNAVNNQSRDDARIVQTELPLPSGIPAASLEAIVKGAWNVLKSVEETGFTAMNGQQYQCQFDVAKSSVWIDNVQPSSSSKEFACWNLQLKLAGRHYYSKPPKWMGTGPEPPTEKRQLDWMPTWNYQVEWFMIEIKKLIESNSSV